MTIRKEDPIRGQQIKEVLDEVGLTQSQFAECIGKTRQYVSLVVQGKRQLKLDDEQVMKLADVTSADEEFWLALSGGGDVGPSPARGAVDDVVPSDKDKLERQWSQIGPRTLTDGEIELAVKLGYLGIEPFDPDLLCPTKMYFTVASKGLKRTAKSCKVINLDNGVELAQNEILTVKSEQEFRMPGRITAELGQVAENVRSGITVHHGLGIDPTWSGRLVCRLENKGAYPVTIQTGMKLLSARFEFVATEPKRIYQAVPHEEVEEDFTDLDFRTAGRPEGENQKRSPRKTTGKSVGGDDLAHTIAEFVQMQNEAMQANNNLINQFAALLKERGGK